jgi:hypothetical protein
VCWSVVMWCTVFMFFSSHGLPLCGECDACMSGPCGCSHFPIVTGKGEVRNKKVGKGLRDESQLRETLCLNLYIRGA